MLLQLPHSLAELEEIADAVARYARDVVLLAGGRVKHMSLGMNAVLAATSRRPAPAGPAEITAPLARGPKPVPAAPPFPVTEVNAELGLTVCARGAVFAGTGLDIGTRFLLDFLPRMPHATHAVDLGCGTGILAAMYARAPPAPASPPPTGPRPPSRRPSPPPRERPGRPDRRAPGRRHELPPDASADLILLNPPFHLEAAVHSGAGIKLIEAAGRVLAPGGELWTVFNSHLHYRPALERLIGPTREAGRNPKFTVTASTRRP